MKRVWAVVLAAAVVAVLAGSAGAAFAFAANGALPFGGAAASAGTIVLTSENTAISCPVYNEGSVRNPKVTYTGGLVEETLKRGTDYTAVYYDANGVEVAAAELCNAGIYTAKLTGIGDYSGEVTLRFAIDALAEGKTFVGKIPFEPSNAAELATTVDCGFEVTGTGLNPTVKITRSLGEEIPGNTPIPYNTAGAITIPSTITYNGTTYTVTATESFGSPEASNTEVNNCMQLTGITLPDTITSIPSHFCSYSTALTDVHLPDTITVIQTYAFSNCTSLTRFEFPAYTKTIGALAFYECSMERVVLPASVTSIGVRALQMTSDTTIAYLECLGDAPRGIGDSLLIMKWNGTKGEWEYLPNYPDVLVCGGDLGEAANLEGLNAYCTIDYYADEAALEGGSPTCSVAAALGTDLSDVKTEDLYVAPDERFGDTVPEGTYVYPEGFDARAVNRGGKAWRSHPLAVGTAIAGTAALRAADGTESAVPCTYVVTDATEGAATVSVQGTDGACAVDVAAAGELVLPASIENRAVPYAVTAIGANAFSQGADASKSCTHLTRIDVPASVKSIGAGAFASCTALSALVFAGDGDGISFGEGLFAHTSSLRAVVWRGKAGALTESGAKSYFAVDYYRSNRAAEAREGAFACVAALSDTDLTAEVPASSLFAGTGFASSVPAGSCTYLDGIEPAALKRGGRAYVVAEAEGRIVSVEIPFAPSSVLDARTTVPCRFKVTKSVDGEMPEVSVYGDASARAVDTALAGAITIPDTVTAGGVDYLVTGFAGNAFSYNDNAMECCARLTRVDIPEGIEALPKDLFAHCTGLKAVGLPESLKSIGEGAFRNSGLAEAAIPAGVTEIPGDAFAYCSSLSSVALHDGITGIGTSAFYGCASLAALQLPGSLMQIGANAFQGCSALTAIELPEGVAHIGAEAFAKTKIADITLPKSLKSLGAKAFETTGLLKVTVLCDGSALEMASDSLPTSVTTIVWDDKRYAGASALPVSAQQYFTVRFYDFEADRESDTRLHSVVVKEGANLDSPAEGDVYEGELPAFTNFTFEEGTDRAKLGDTCSAYYPMPSVGTAVKGSVSVASSPGAKAVDIDCVYKITSRGQFCEVCVGASETEAAIDVATAGIVTVPEAIVSEGIAYGVTAIGNVAFRMCEDITDFNLPTTIQSAGYQSFKSCYGLTSIYLPEGMVSLGSQCFCDCTNLVSVSLPSTFRNFADYVFHYSKNIKTVEFRGDAAEVTMSAKYPPFGAVDTIDYNYTPDIETFIWHGTRCRHEGLAVAAKAENCFAVRYHAAPGSDEVIATVIYRQGSRVEAGAAASDILRGTVPAVPAGYSTWSVESDSRNCLQEATDAYPVTALPARERTVTFSLGTGVTLTSATLGGQTISVDTDSMSARIDRAAEDRTLEFAFDVPDGYTLTNVTVDGQKVYQNDTGAFVYTDMGGDDGDLVVVAKQRKMEGFTYQGVFYQMTSGTNGSYEVQAGSGRYNPNSNNEAYSGDIVIPESFTIDGETFTVTSIADYAFEFATKVTSLSIPDTVRTIGYSAFGRMYGVETLQLPRSLTSLESRACTSMSALKTVTFRGDAADIAVGSHVFDYDSNLENIVWYGSENTSEAVRQTSASREAPATEVASAQPGLADYWYVVRYYASEEAAEAGGEPLAQVACREFSDVAGSIDPSDVLVDDALTDLDAAAPDILGDGERWKFSITGASALRACCAAWPTASTATGELLVAKTARGITMSDLKLDGAPVELDEHGAMPLTASSSERVLSFGATLESGYVDLVVECAGKSVVADTQGIFRATIPAGASSARLVLSATRCWELQYDGVYYAVVGGGNGEYEVQIGGTKTMGDGHAVSTSAREANLHEHFTVDGKGYTPTSIADGAFFGCELLQSLVIPDTVKTIGYRSIEYCYALTYLKYPAGLISDNAYGTGRWCGSLETVEFGADWDDTRYNLLNKVANGIWRGTANTDKATNNFYTIDYYWHEDQVGVEEPAFTVAYKEGTDLSDIFEGDIYEGVASGFETKVPAGTWTYSEGIDQDNVRCAGYAVCANAPKVGDILKQQVWVIDDSSRALKEMSFRVTSVSGGTPTVELYGSDTARCIDTASAGAVKVPETIAWGDGALTFTVTGIAAKAFSDGTAAGTCSGLTSITLPNGITALPDGAFAGCTALKGMSIAGSVTAIGSKAFSGCTAITSFTVPAAVKTIGTGAFAGCSGLTRMDFEGNAADITVDANAFPACVKTVVWGGKRMQGSAVEAFASATQYVTVAYYPTRLDVRDGVPKSTLVLKRGANLDALGEGDVLSGEVPSGVWTYEAGIDTAKIDDSCYAYFLSNKWDGSVDVSWYLNALAADPACTEFHITNEAEWAGFAYLCSEDYEQIELYYGIKGVNDMDTFAGKTVYLDADLDMGGIYDEETGEWSGPNYLPIGGQYPVDKSDPDAVPSTLETHIMYGIFSGTFEGQGHWVRNIYCSRWNSQYMNSQAVALFGRIGSGDETAWGDPYPQVDSVIIRDVGVTGFIHANRSVGGIVGKTLGTGKGFLVENCINAASVSNTDAKGVGGIVGAAWNGGTIRHCANLGQVTSTYNCPAGGIVGSAECTVENCYNAGTVSARTASFAMGIGTDNNGAGTRFTNCVWREDSAKGGGCYANSTDQMEDCEELSAAEMKASEFALRINGPASSAFVADAEVNDGYPALAWQVDFAENDLAAASVSGLEESYDLGDKPIEPAVTVTLDGKELVPEVDYDAVYENNDAVGLATLKIVACEGGDYVGTKALTFRIVGVQLAVGDVFEVPVPFVAGAAAAEAASLTGVTEEVSLDAEDGAQDSGSCQGGDYLLKQSSLGETAHRAVSVAAELASSPRPDTRSGDVDASSVTSTTKCTFRVTESGAAEGVAEVYGGDGRAVDSSLAGALTLPASVMYRGVTYAVAGIAEGSFAGGTSGAAACTGLTSVKIEAAVASLPKGCFDGCSALASVELPASLETVGERAFAGTALRAIELPAGVSSLSAGAFAGCSSLEELRFAGDASGCSVAADALPGTLERVVWSGERKADMKLPAGCMQYVTVRYFATHADAVEGTAPVATVVVKEGANLGALGADDVLEGAVPQGTYVYEDGATPASVQDSSIAWLPVPSAPRNVEVEPGDGSAQLWWEAPADDGGFPVTRYEVLRDGVAVKLVEATETGAVVVGLTNGTACSFTVRAVNEKGAGVQSAAVNCTPAANPARAITVAGDIALDAPASAEGGTQVTVSWADAPLPVYGVLVRNAHTGEELLQAEAKEASKVGSVGFAMPQVGVTVEAMYGFYVYEQYGESGTPKLTARVSYPDLKSLCAEEPVVYYGLAKGGAASCYKLGRAITLVDLLEAAEVTFEAGDGLANAAEATGADMASVAVAFTYNDLVGTERYSYPGLASYIAGESTLTQCKETGFEAGPVYALDSSGRKQASGDAYSSATRFAAFQFAYGMSEKELQEKTGTIMNFYGGANAVIVVHALTDISNYSLSGITETYDWTGSAIELAPEVTDLAGNALKAGVDFTWSVQSKGTDAWEPVEAAVDEGAYRVVVTGAGKYSGSLAAEFSVAKRAWAIDTSENDPVYKISVRSEGAAVQTAKAGAEVLVSVETADPANLVKPVLKATGFTVATEDGTVVYDSGSSAAGSFAMPNSYVSIEAHGELELAVYEGTQGREASLAGTLSLARMEDLAVRDTRYAAFDAAGKVNYGYAQTAVRLTDILYAANVDFVSGDTVTISGGDGVYATFTFDELYGQKRYYYPNISLLSTAGAVPLEPMLSICGVQADEDSIPAGKTITDLTADRVRAYRFFCGITENELSKRSGVTGSFLYLVTSITVQHAKDPDPDPDPTPETKISVDKLDIAWPAEQVVAGSSAAKQLGVSAAYQGKSLSQGTDYTISYARCNEAGAWTETADLTSSGLVRVTLTGMGGYTGATYRDVKLIGTTTLAGDGRYDTAAAIALEAYPEGATGVIVAYGRNFPDALAASGLSGMLGYPVLLTESGELPSATASAVSKLAPSEIIVLGGVNAVSDGVVSALSSYVGGNVRRIAGENRVETALAVYKEGVARGSWGGTAIVATGRNYPDALSISPFAAYGVQEGADGGAGRAGAVPIFLATDADTLDTGVVSALGAGGFSRVIVVGGTAVVSDAVAVQIGTCTGGAAVVRLGGSNRYATSAAIGRWLVAQAGMTLDGTGVATGANYPDALAGASLLGRSGSVLLLAAEGEEEALGLLDGSDGVCTLRFFGGESALPASVRQRAVSLLGWPAGTL